MSNDELITYIAREILRSDMNPDVADAVARFIVMVEASVEADIEPLSREAALEHLMIGTAYGDLLTEVDGALR